MGMYDSSRTRVQPIFGALMASDPTGGTWLGALWRMAAATRPEVAIEEPPQPGLPLTHQFERVVPPSVAFLRWAITNPDRLRAPDTDFGAKGEEARTKRGHLRGSDERLKADAMREAVEQLERAGVVGSGRRWWAFEGFTHVDCAIETPECLLFIEGKRTEAVSASTRWFESRNQLWRNVEVAGELAGEKAFGVILAVESEANGNAALQDVANTRDSSYPHLEQERRAELDRHFLGFVVWADIVRQFGLPPSVLRATTAD